MHIKIIIIELRKLYESGLYFVDASFKLFKKKSFHEKFQFLYNTYLNNNLKKNFK